VVAGAHPVGVEALAEEELTGEAAVRALGGDDPVVLGGLPAPLRRHAEDVLLHRHLDGGRLHAWQVEVHDVLVAVVVGVHRHGRRGRRGQVLREAVQLTEGIEPHQHR
jgi:hypothetical protein